MNDTVAKAIQSSILPALGFTAHLRSADGTSITLSSERYQAVIRVYLSKYGELRARIWTMLDKSLLTVGIEEISFPHKNLLNFLFKIKEVYHLTRRT